MGTEARTFPQKDIGQKHLQDSIRQSSSLPEEAYAYSRLQDLVVSQPVSSRKQSGEIGGKSGLSLGFVNFGLRKSRWKYLSTTGKFGAGN